MKFPPPEQNPHCRCRANSGRTFWCRYGHVTECHYPYTCRQAGCSHLAQYKMDSKEPAELEAQAKTAIRAGQRPPYVIDNKGGVRIAAPEPGKK